MKCTLSHEDLNQDVTLIYILNLPLSQNGTRFNLMNVNGKDIRSV